MTRRAGRRGMAMLLAIMAVAVVSILATVVASTVLGMSKVARIERAREALGLVAESGVELAIARLAADRKWSGSDRELVPGGSCRIAAKTVGPGNWEITSRAAKDGRECLVCVRVQSLGQKLQITQWQMKHQPSPNPGKKGV